MEIFQTEKSLSLLNQIMPDLVAEHSLFVDIETTGFSHKHTHVYMIGCAYVTAKGIRSKQFFAETPEQEPCLLKSFTTFLCKFKLIITYNGLGFDIPYIIGRCQILGLPESFAQHTFFDIYKTLSPYKKLLKLPDFKQKSLEAFLGILRNDRFSGGELINLYQEYTKTPNPELLKLFQLHNLEDVMGMIEILPLLNYTKIFAGFFEIYSRETVPYQEFKGRHSYELIFNLTLEYPFPRRISYGFDDIYLTGYRNKAKLKIKIYQGDLKFFYSKYKDYYYLPNEDQAIHKSIAFYVDKDFRTKAKAATCYSRKNSSFLPQYQEIISPYFKMEYHDRITYFEIGDEFNDSVEKQKEYILHLLYQMIRK
jgi:uncharacterized protein YprB with RNaseH-like and TPR domain